MITREERRGNFVAVTTDEPQTGNWHTAIYEDDYKGLLIAMCNQNGRYPWQVNAILAGLNGKREAMEASARPAAADAGVREALAIAEREITARIRHGLAETGMSAEQISALVDANPAIVAIRRTAALSSSKQKDGRE